MPWKSESPIEVQKGVVDDGGKGMRAEGKVFCGYDIGWVDLVLVGLFGILCGRRVGEGIRRFSHHFVRKGECCADKTSAGGSRIFRASLAAERTHQAGDTVTVSVDTTTGVSEPRLLALRQGFVLELGPTGVVVGRDYEVSVDGIF